MTAHQNGYVPVSVDKVLLSERGGVILLVTDQEPYVGKVLPVFVDTGQAVNIQLALTNEIPPRPFTHDLLTTILNELGAIVIGLSVDELAQNTFFSTIEIEMERGGKTVIERFDARPSDGIALALRADAPIRIRATVLDSAAVDPDELFGDDSDSDDMPGFKLEP
jgi:hypothetical protein